MALFDSDFLQKLEYLSLLSRRVFRGHLLAQRRTRQLGSGVEFAEHRDYALGDDFRYIDWNVYARHGDLLLKRFQEEEDLHVYVLLDCSRSMDLGEPSKFDYARQVAAALSYIALAHLDRVAVLAFAGDVVASFPLTRGKERLHALLRFLEQLQLSAEVTDLGRAAQALLSYHKRRGLALVVSDLFDPRGFEAGLDLLRFRHYEPQVVQVYAAAEARPELVGDLELVDVETGQLRKVTVTEKNLTRYRQVFEGYLQSLRRYATRYGLTCTQTPTAVPFDELIIRMMRRAGAVA